MNNDGVGEIACFDYEEAVSLSKILMNNDYVVMLSREESLTIVNYLYSANCDRNLVIFQDEGLWEMERDRTCKDCMKEWGINTDD